MNRQIIINGVLLAGVALIIGANFTIRGNPTSRNFDVLPEMVASVPYDSFSANPNFADGMTLRPMVAGTVTYRSTPLHYGTTPEEAQRAGRELANPAKPDAATLARGQAIYMTYCEVCHGPAGKSDGPVAQRGYPAPPPFVDPAAKSRAMADGQIFHIITYGQNNMPSYALQIEPADRWKAVLWVRELQRKAGVAAPVVAASQAAGASK
ncbi:MAG: c-type cytochrome [Thermoanaerobaculia bacterium]